MNKINAVQPNTLYRVNAVQLFENRQKGNPFDSNLFAAHSNSEFNLNHPKVSGDGMNAKHLDLLA